MGDRWAHQRRDLPPLHREGFRPTSRRAMSSSWTTSEATKNKAARAILRAKGAHLIFLPPYSPDLNPIEQVFAKLKHLLRKAQSRDVEATWRKVGQLIDLFSPAECGELPRQLRRRFRLSESCRSLAPRQQLPHCHTDATAQRSRRLAAFFAVPSCGHAHPSIRAVADSERPAASVSTPSISFFWTRSVSLGDPRDRQRRS